MSTKNEGYQPLVTARELRERIRQQSAILGIRHNFEADSAPGVNDDEDEGYRAGSRWITTGALVYECVDPTAGAAEWRIRPKNNYSASAAPGTGDDEDDGYSVGSEWIITGAGDATDGDIYKCVDPSAGAAVWQLVHDDTA